MSAFACTRVSTMVLASALVTAAAHAQQATDPPPRPVSSAVEVTPFVSLGSTGASPIGAAVSFPVTSKVSIETETGYRRGEGDVKAVSSTASVLYALPRVGRTTPYLAAGAGLGQYGAPVIARDGAIIGTERRTAFLVNAGGGLKVKAGETWGMRTDARWFKSFGNNGSEHWRVAHGVSFDVGKR